MKSGDTFLTEPFITHILTTADDNLLNCVSLLLLIEMLINRPKLCPCLLVSGFRADFFIRLNVFMESDSLFYLLPLQDSSPLKCISFFEHVQVSIELLRILLHLEDEYNINGFYGLRMNAMVTITTKCPSLVCKLCST